MYVNDMDTHAISEYYSHLLLTSASDVGYNRTIDIGLIP